MFHRVTVLCYSTDARPQGSNSFGGEETIYIEKKKRDGRKVGRRKRLHRFNRVVLTVSFQHFYHTTCSCYCETARETPLKREHVSVRPF